MTTTAVTVLAVLLCTSPLGPPQLKPPKHGVYVVAHRGVHTGIPENTLAAYQKAIELGCDFVEIDVRTSKDGAFVSIHNRTVDAYVTDGTTGKVKDFTLAELKALDIGNRVDPKWKNERVPTFEDILKLCKGKIGIYLDLKEAPIEPLIAMVKQYGMEHDVLWYIDAQDVKTLREHCRTCIPMPDPGPEEHLAKLIAQTRPQVVASVWRFYSESFVQDCHDAGAIVIVDESDETSWEPALAWGSDGIQTDDPAGLIAYLEKRADSK
jgi:glycerophosphoryl diester phosphodiesterase